MFTFKHELAGSDDVQFEVIFESEYGPYLKCNPRSLGGNSRRYVDLAHFTCAYGHPYPGSNPWIVPTGADGCAAPCQRVNVSVGKDPAHHVWNTMPAAKHQVSSYFGGYWYSTPHLGQCTGTHTPGDGSGCTWKVTSAPKYANASCVADQLCLEFSQYGYTALFLEYCRPLCPLPETYRVYTSLRSRAILLAHNIYC